MKKCLLVILLLCLCACQKEEVVSENYYKAGVGQASYVNSFDASLNQYGIFRVNTTVVSLIMNQDDIIENIYFDECENEMLFNHNGKEITTGRVEEWPSKKEIDETYTSEMSALEKAAIGLSFNDYLLYIEQSDLNDDDKVMMKAALEHAYAKAERMDHLKEVAIGIINRHSFKEYSDTADGTLLVNTTYAVVYIDQDEQIIDIELDEIENKANFDENAMIVTARFDTRSKVEKKEDYGLLPFSKLHKEYYLQIDSLKEALIGKTFQEAEDYFKSDELKSHCSIDVSDLLYALIKSQTNKIAL